MKNIKNIIKYTVVGCFLQSAIVILMNYIFQHFQISAFEHYVCSLFFADLILLAIAFIANNKKNTRFNEEKLVISGNTIYFLAGVIILGLGFCMFNHLIYALPIFESIVANSNKSFAHEIINSIRNTIIWYILMCLFVPIVEEFFFRGILQKSLIKEMDVKKGIILVALIFSFLHGADFIFVIPFSLTAGYLYYNKKNIIYPIVLHISNNSFAAILGNICDTSQKSTMAIVGILGIIIVVIGFLTLYKLDNEKT